MARFDNVTEAGLQTLVDRFYRRVRADLVLGPVFETAVDDWDDHIAQLVRFWSSVALGSRLFKGDPVGVHRRLPITPDMFPRWLTLWGETVDDLFEPAAAAPLRSAAERIGRSLSLAVHYQPWAPVAV